MTAPKAKVVWYPKLTQRIPPRVGTMKPEIWFIVSPVKSVDETSSGSVILLT